MTSTPALAEQVRIAHRNVDRAKIMYANKLGTYEEMAAAARELSRLTFEYQKERFPQTTPRRIPYQAILR